jgi:short-subunit dehydrogenase
MTKATTPSKGTAIITGASSGIGATYADRLARRGYDLLLVARDQQRLQILATRLAAETGVKAEILPADLTVKADLARVEQRLRDDAAITLLVNNAGMATAGTFLESDIDKVEAMILLNVLAVTRLAAAVVPGLLTRGQGGIINVASVLALAPEMFNGAYNGTKAFVLSLTQSLQYETQGRGLRVQAVLPGATRTEIWERSGLDIASMPQEIIMGVDEMVDAALAGFDSGELVTIPSLPNLADWDTFNAARLALAPNLSLAHAAPRYHAAG